MSNTVKIRSDLLYENPKYQKASNKHKMTQEQKIKIQQSNNSIIEEKWEVKRCSLNGK